MVEAIDPWEEDKITIVLATYNRAPILSRCLNATLNQTYTNWELFVIDDSSQDNTKSVVKAYLHDARIHYVKNSKNLGMTKSREKGLKLCNTDLIFIHEDDIILDKDCLNVLVHTFRDLEKKIPNLFCLAPKPILATSGTHQSPVLSEFKINVLTGYPYIRYGERFTETPILPSVGLYSFSLLKKIGFSKDYIGKPCTHEDDDLHLRARKCGFRLFYQPKAVAYHLWYHHGGERSFNLLKQQYFICRNHICFVVKFFRLRSLYMGLFFTFTHLLYPVEVIMSRNTLLRRILMKDLKTFFN